MAIGLLLSASKFLGGAISKAKSPNAENTATVDKGGKGKPGAIVKSEKVSITPTSPMVGSGVVSTFTTPKKVVKPISKVSFSSITNQLDSMVALTSMIDTVTQKNTEGQKRASQLARKSKENQKKKDREEKSESGSGALGFLGGKAVEAGNKFGIFNFLTSILLGIGALALIDLTKKLSNGFDGLGDVFGGVVEGFKLFGLAIAAVAKDFPKILKNTKNLFSKIKFGDKLKKLGTGLKNVFGKLGKKLIPGFISKITGAVKSIRNGFNAARNLGRAGLEAARRGLTFDTRTKLPGATNKGLNKLINDVGRGSGGGGGFSRGIGDGFRRLPGSSGRTNINTISKATQTIRARYGDEAARLYQRSIDRGLKSADALSDVRKAISSGKITSQPLTGLARQGGGSQLLKGGIKQTSKRALIKFIGKGGAKAVLGTLGRVPLIGPLIVGVASFLETGKLDQALFRAGGALIGGFLGTFIPIPVIGTLMGELLGEYVGDLFYILLRGGGSDALGKKLQDDLKGILTAGQAAMGWAGDGFKRMYEGIPKFKLPDLGWANASVYGPTNLLLGATAGMKIQDIEMPNPFWFIDPRTAADKFKLIGKAFFSRDPMKEGEVKKEDKEKQTNNSDDEKFLSETKVLTEQEYYNERVLNHGLPDTYDEYARMTGSGTGSETTRVMGNPTLTSQYGEMRGSKMHGGTDIAATPGAALVPVTDATIVDYGKLSLTGAKRGDPYGWGNFIVYKDSQGYYHLYGHVLESGMKTGGSVKKGVPIAKVGSTGRSSGPHLHWEMGTSWSGGTLGGKMDPLSVYRVEDPFTVGGVMSDNSSTREIKKSTMSEPKREDFGSGRSGGKKYAEALKAYRAEMQSQPEISPQSSPSASVSGVESQASYEQTGGGSVVVLSSPQQQSLGGGGSSGGGGVMRMGSGDVLNSYYRAQLLGFLYKQG